MEGLGREPSQCGFRGYCLSPRLCRLPLDFTPQQALLVVLVVVVSVTDGLALGRAGGGPSNWTACYRQGAEGGNIMQTGCRPGLSDLIEVMAPVGKGCGTCKPFLHTLDHQTL